MLADGLPAVAAGVPGIFPFLNYLNVCFRSKNRNCIRIHVFFPFFFINLFYFCQISCKKVARSMFYFVNLLIMQFYNCWFGGVVLVVCLVLGADFSGGGVVKS